MRVKFRVSLGRDDAKKFGLDAEKCRRGATVDVSPESASVLKAKYPAIFEEQADIHAVAPRPAITAPAKTDK
jgi:hypothetical protein